MLGKNFAHTAKQGKSLMSLILILRFVLIFIAAAGESAPCLKSLKNRKSAAF